MLFSSTYRFNLNITSSKMVFNEMMFNIQVLYPFESAFLARSIQPQLSSYIITGSDGVLHWKSSKIPVNQIPSETAALSVTYWDSLDNWRDCRLLPACPRYCWTIYLKQETSYRLAIFCIRRPVSIDISFEWSTSWIFLIVKSYSSGSLKVSHDTLKSLPMAFLWWLLKSFHVSYGIAQIRSHT